MPRIKEVARKLDVSVAFAAKPSAVFRAADRPSPKPRATRPLADRLAYSLPEVAELDRGLFRPRPQRGATREAGQLPLRAPPARV